MFSLINSSLSIAIRDIIDRVSLVGSSAMILVIQQQFTTFGFGRFAT